MGGKQHVSLAWQDIIPIQKVWLSVKNVLLVPQTMPPTRTVYRCKSIWPLGLPGMTTTTPGLYYSRGFCLVNYEVILNRGITASRAP